MRTTRSVRRLTSHFSTLRAPRILSQSSARGLSDKTAREPTRWKVYTKTGDKGTSSLYNGNRRPKDDIVFEALGATDELNSFVGVAREFCIASPVLNTTAIVVQLSEIQSALMDIGSAVATPLTGSSEWKIERTKWDETRVESLEAYIDEMDAQLPPLKNFILPSGGLASSQLHVCRTTARRAERLVVPLVRAEDVEPEVGIFLNRLSDYFFVAARYAAMQDNQLEAVYQKWQGVHLRTLREDKSS